MQKVIVVYSSNRAIEREFYCTLLLLAKMGAHIIEQWGAPDVGFARNAALTLVTHELAANPDKYDTVLMLDDDMFVVPEVVTELVEHSRKTRRPASACYQLSDGRIAADPIEEGGGYMTGLGCIAIPVESLLALARTVPIVRFFAGFSGKGPHGPLVRAFTYSGIEPDGTEWIGEDYRLCLRLGGVDLLPLAAHHIKKRLLFPTLEAMREIVP